MRSGLGATYRLQLRPGFGFVEAAGVVGYLAELGVELVYLSPVTEAPPGSSHGYDVADPTALRAELGGRHGFDALCAEIDSRGLGLLLDIVPNHMSTWIDGPWWGDVLRRGQDSPLAAVFDIDWDAGDGADKGKVALPVLDRPLAEVLASGALGLQVNAAGLRLRFGRLSYPVTGLFDVSDDVEEVLAAQHYRLIPWHDASQRNYRRFLDLNDLVGVRQEQEEVFLRTHALVAELAQGRRISAVRVDHVDGLGDPSAYLHRLEELLGGLPILVEKVLTGDERLPDSWPVAGTTGYEVIDDIAGALVDAEGQGRLVASSRRDGEHRVDDEIRSGKREAADGAFRAEVARVAGLLGASSADVRETLVRMRSYRSYPGDPASEEMLSQAAGPVVLEGLRGDARGRDARRRFEQLSTGVAAKGIEDTTWYRLAGPLAFCEVGGDPSRSRAGGPERLAARAAARAARGRAGLVPGTTHDTKRSGDVRARLLALSEMADAFEAGLVRFGDLAPVGYLAEGTAVPSALERRFLAETMLAVLPASSEGWTDLEQRVLLCVTKAAREAKLRSSWTDPDPVYEAALGAVVTASLSQRGALLRRAFGDLVDDVARVGAVLSLSDVVLRSVSPGYPDCYQGDETWNLSLVDPDNRRPVDFATASRRLEALTAARTGDEPASLRSSWRDGRIKLLVTRQALRARRAAPAAFEPAAEVAEVEARGSRAGHAVTLGRRALQGGAFALAVGTKGTREMPAGRDDLPVGRASWGSTALLLPAGAPRLLVDALTGRRHESLPSPGAPEGSRYLWMAEVLRDLPVAVLVGAC